MVWLVGRDTCPPLNDLLEQGLCFLKTLLRRTQRCQTRLTPEGAWVEILKSSINTSVGTDSGLYALIDFLALIPLKISILFPFLFYQIIEQFRVSIQQMKKSETNFFLKHFSNRDFIYTGLSV